MPKAMIIPADEAQPVRFEELSGLEAMQKVVGGYIELVPMTLNIAGTQHEVSLFCNEEGKLEGLPLNRRATQMAGRNLRPGDYLAGDVFLTGAPDDDGNETDVPVPDCFRA